MLEKKTVIGKITSIDSNYVMTPMDIARHTISHSFELNEHTLVTTNRKVIAVYYGKCSTVLVVEVTLIETEI